MTSIILYYYLRMLFKERCLLQAPFTAPYVTLATDGLPGDLAHILVEAALKCDVATKMVPMRTSGVEQRVTMAASFMAVAVTVYLEQ